MALSKFNSACDCCTKPPDPLLEIQYSSIEQSCSRTSCGFGPCASGPLDENTNKECSPNYNDLTVVEKCEGQRYLVETFTDTDGHTEITTYTKNPITGECLPEKTCAGTVTIKTRTVYERPFGADGRGRKMSHDATVTEVITYNEDCTTSTVTTCSGYSNVTIIPSGDNPYTLTCNSTADENCNGWNGTSDCTGGEEGECDGDFPITFTNGQSCVDFYLNVPLFGVATTTVEQIPEPTNVKKYVYSQPDEDGDCFPKELPSFPAFGTLSSCRLDESEVPPTTPELIDGQGYSDSAYQYVNPNYEAIRSLRKVQFRVAHSPTATCYLKVWFRKVTQSYKYEDCETGFPGDPPRTQPENHDCSGELTDLFPELQCPSRWSTDGPPVYDSASIPPYVWEGKASDDGSLCFSDEKQVFIACGNAIYDKSPKTLEAPLNSNVTIEYKYSFIKDYEPNWPDINGSKGCKPDGFPILNPAECELYISPSTQ